MLQRRLRLFDATTLVAGSMIGSGIFLALPIMARQVETPGILLGLWVFGGLFTVVGAISCAELAAMFPHAGGQYVYLREAYNNFWAFLFGWTQFLVIQTGFIAAVAIAFATYLGVLLPRLGEETVLMTIPPSAARPVPSGHVSVNSAQLVACGLIALLTWVNARGVREGALVQNLFTVLKVATLTGLIVAGFWHFHSPEHFRPWFHVVPGEDSLEAGLAAGLAVALSKALFSYDAWNTVTFVAEEVHDAHRTLPRALLFGTLGVMFLYVLTNAAYLAVLPVERIAADTTDRVAETAAAVMFGPLGSTLVVLGILISSFGCINGLILGGARVTYAMAREGLFFRACARLSPRRTPATALWCQAGWAMILSLSGSYSKLLTYTAFASVAFGGLMVAAVYRLRRLRPDAQRPYRCWGYPITPAIYLLICVPFLVYVVRGDPVSTLFGAALVLSGIPFYLMWRKMDSRAQ